MAKPVPIFELKSYGLYSAWDRESKALPKIIKHTLEIPAEAGIEFGFILSVKKGKGETLDYIIDHPPFKDKDGNLSPPFEGSYFINSNDFLFFLGDTIWEPVEDKKGLWILTIYYKEKEIIKKTFRII